MTVKEWRETYDDDLEKFVLAETSGEAEVDSIIQQVTASNSKQMEQVTFESVTSYP
jgi:hypothetical protein